MGKKKKVNAPKAPEYASANYNTGGLFGNSTTNEKGTTYKPITNISNLGTNSWGGWGSALNAINNFNNRDFTKDPNYQVYANNLQRQMRNNYNNTVLNTLANNGLMRSSGLQASTNAFNDTLANQTADLYDRYYNNQLGYLNNKLSANQSSLNNLYNYINGINSGSQNNANNVNTFNLSNYNNKLTKALMDSQNQGNGGQGALNGAMSGASAGSAFGPWGALAGGIIGGVSGYMQNR